MLAQVAEVAFDSAQHLFEIKWDGIRCLALIQGRRARLQSRQLTEITLQFPELACLSQFPSGTVLDGELVVLREGRPSLRCIQQRALLQKRTSIEHLSRSTPVTYMVFDLLYFQGQSLMASPLSTRREALQSLIGEHPLPGVLLPEAVRQHGCRLFAQVVRLGLEGIMAKRKDSKYLPGRRSDLWLKIKVRQTAECVVIGYTEGKGNRGQTFGALHIADKTGDELHYRGKVGTGFDDALMKEIYAELQKLAKVKTVPDSLGGALDALEKDHAFLLKGDVFTKDLLDTYIEYKRKKEIDYVRLRPHPAEFQLYFDA